MKRFISTDLGSNLLPDIFDNVCHGIAIVGLDGKWLLVSKSLSDILGYSEKELQQFTFQDITHKEDRDLDLEKLNGLMDGRLENYKTQKRYFTKKGNMIWAQLSISLVKDSHDQPKYFIAQVQDITKRKKKEEEKAIVARVVKEQNERLLNFSRIITHNLKTHAGNLITLTHFVENEVPQNVDNESFGFLKQALQNLQNTVDHLTEIAMYSRLDKSELKALNLNAFMVNAIYNVSSLAKNSNCKIENLIDKELEVMGIEAYLDSILLNLLTNAIKYRARNRKGHIVLKTHQEDGRVILRVKDNGMGIDLEKYGRKMFSLYQTFHKQPDSTGVGLFITKNQVEALGGKIKVKSKVDVGSEFLVYFQKGYV